MRQHLPRTRLAAALLTGLLVAACSQGSGSRSTQQQDDFALESIGVAPGAVWALNRPIILEFNQEVDLATVSPSTIRIRRTDGLAALGDFDHPPAADGTPDRRRVRFRPACPSQGDLSDAGLTAGGVDYSLAVPGAGSGTALRSLEGRSLERGGSVSFRTATGSSAQELFLDDVPGPPSVRLRGDLGVDPEDPRNTYLELAEDPGQRLYFERGTDQVGRLPAGSLAPLNLFSRSETRVALVVQLNQAVLPGEGNVNAESLRLEWSTDGMTWSPLVTRVSLESNCGDVGARVRLEPLGLLPADAELRLAVAPGLRDIAGNPSQQAILNGARFRSQPVEPADQPGVDELLERFASGGDGLDSREDRRAVLGAPAARWGEGRLEATFGFEGTGGPGGNFDLYLTPGEDLVLDGSLATITGGPGGTPVATQEVRGGVLDLRDLRVPVGSRLIFVGPDPITILASGQVRVAGEISVRGSNNGGVGSLNAANQPEVGAAGNAGGGRGGTGSQLVSQSTPQGGPGFGAFGQPGRGGGGGETGFGLGGENNRRGAGGGGARFGPDVRYDHDGLAGTPTVHAQTLIGMDAEAGFGGTPTGQGALSQSGQPVGGEVGPSPFLDDNDGNDFFGKLLTTSGELVIGELDQVWAGGGGGAGGDAVNSASFPLVPFLITGDEKGSGGGGGGGGLSILAIGPIIVEQGGRIVADGGYGGGGENTFTSARVGGGGGGGAGGHVVLSSAAYVELQDQAPETGPEYRDDPLANTHVGRALSALGGQGGEGRVGRGGADQNGPTQWRRDAIPMDRLEPDVPPLSQVYLNTMPDEDDPLGPALAAGGDGSPGLIQIHVEDPTTDLRLTGVGGTYGVPGGADVTRVSAPPPVGWRSVDEAADRSLPFFGRQSASQSRWIHLGVGRLDENGQRLPFEFESLGTDPATGQVPTAAGQVQDPSPVLGPQVVGQGPDEARLLEGGLGLALDATDLELALRLGPQLTVGFDLVLSDAASPLGPTSFEVVAAEYEGPSQRLRVHVAPTDRTPGEVVALADGPVTAALVPRLFRVGTAGEPGRLPEEASLFLTWDATRSNGNGQPDEAAAWSTQNGGKLTGNPTLFNGGDWQWVRFRAVFDLGGGTDTVPLGAPRPYLELLRLPFRF